MADHLTDDHFTVSQEFVDLHGVPAIPGIRVQVWRPGNSSSFTGRVPRGTFWITWAILAIVGITIALFADMWSLGYTKVEFPKTKEDIWVATLLLLILIPIIWVTLAIQVKRWHDLGVSGWVLLLAFIPIVNLGYLVLAFVILGFIKGTTGPNKYGPDPLQVHADETRLAGISEEFKQLKKAKARISKEFEQMKKAKDSGCRSDGSDWKLRTLGEQMQDIERRLGGN